jgi:hypothetical protein
MFDPRQRTGSPDGDCDPTELMREYLSDARWMRRRERFYEKALGPMRQPGVYHWEDDHDPHIDVYVFGSSGERRHETLVTGGMADRPMPDVPAGNGRPRRVEILLAVDRAEDWAAMILREIASLPFTYGVALCEGALIEGARSIRPGSELKHAVLRRADEPGLDGFVVDGDVVRFLEPVFVTEREFFLGISRGGPALLERLARAEVPRVLDPGRRCLLADE